MKNRVVSCWKINRQFDWPLRKRAVMTKKELPLEKIAPFVYFHIYKANSKEKTLTLNQTISSVPDSGNRISWSVPISFAWRIGSTIRPMIHQIVNHSQWTRNSQAVAVGRTHSLPFFFLHSHWSLRPRHSSIAGNRWDCSFHSWHDSGLTDSHSQFHLTTGELNWDVFRYPADSST